MSRLFNFLHRNIVSNYLRWEIKKFLLTTCGHNFVIHLVRTRNFGAENSSLDDPTYPREVNSFARMDDSAADHHAWPFNRAGNADSDNGNANAGREPGVGSCREAPAKVLAEIRKARVASLVALGR